MSAVRFRWLSDEFPKIRRIVIAHTFPSSSSISRSLPRSLLLGPRCSQSVSQWMMRLVCVSLSSAPASARARLSPHFPYSAPVSFKLVAQCPPKSTLQSWCVSKKLFFSPGPRMSNFISYLSKRHVLMFEIRVASSGHPVIHMHVSFGIHLRTPGRTDGHATIPAGIRSENRGVRRRRRPSRNRWLLC